MLRTAGRRSGGVAEAAAAAAVLAAAVWQTLLVPAAGLARGAGPECKRLIRAIWELAPRFRDELHVRACSPCALWACVRMQRARLLRATAQQVCCTQALQGSVRAAELVARAGIPCWPLPPMLQL